MTDPFGVDYARLYDAMYANKDYEGECDSLLRAARKHGLRNGARILDVGCGTGRHADVLEARGYEVVGTDRSEAMLEIARSRMGQRVIFRTADEMSKIEEQFDLVVSLFDVFSYQPEYEQQVAFLTAIARWTKPLGLVMLDAWHLPGLWNDPPVQRKVTFTSSDGSEYVRSATPKFDALTGMTEIQFHISSPTCMTSLEVSEFHSMRAFTALELKLLLNQVGIETLESWSSPGFREHLTVRDWHVGVIGRKIT